MTPEEKSHLKAVLAAAGDSLVDALSLVEATKPSPEYNIIQAKTDAVTHTMDGVVIDFGVATFVASPALEPEREAVSEYLQHAIISHLSSGDTQALAILNTAFPGSSDDECMEVSAAERLDAGRYADSILALNGRSLDSHNPWHLSQSFESFVEECSTLREEASVYGASPIIPDASPAEKEIKLEHSSLILPLGFTHVNKHRNKVAELNNSELNSSVGEDGIKLMPSFHSLEDSTVNKCGSNTEVHMVLKTLSSKRRMNCGKGYMAPHLLSMSMSARLH